MTIAPLVMLHGFLGSQNDWQPLIAELSDHPCIALDLPGHGQQINQQIPTLDNFPAWFTQQLQARGIREYHLMGYSLGGRLAMRIAATEPTGLRSLIIENAHPGLTDETSRRARHQQDDHWAARFANEPLLNVLHDWYEQAVFSNLSTQSKQELVTLRSENNPTALASVLRDYSLSRQPDYRHWIKTTSLPLLYLCGTEDHKFQSLSKALQQSAPALKLSLLTGGHNLHRANPTAMASVLREWLNHFS